MKCHTDPWTWLSCGRDVTAVGMHSDAQIDRVLKVRGGLLTHSLFSGEVET
jgi:hypothetical protein